MSLASEGVGTESGDARGSGTTARGWVFTPLRTHMIPTEGGESGDSRLQAVPQAPKL